jgi:LAS superfamily LD-carboxypeptidase LdcB
MRHSSRGGVTPTADPTNLLRRYGDTMVRHRFINSAVSLAIAVAGMLSLAPEQAGAASARGRVLPPPPVAASASGAVDYTPARSIQFVGPARFRGMKVGADGSSPVVAGTWGTMTSATFGADRSATIWGVRYAHLVGGPLKGTWVRVDGDVTHAIGRAPAPPPCRYDDLYTGRRAYNRHERTLLDTIYRLSSSYAPRDLVDTGGLALNAGYRVRTVIGSQLKAMARGASAAGYPIGVVSGYRSYAQQKVTFDYWVSVSGYKQALLTSARPGHSEHQLGTTLDLTTRGGKPPWQYDDWAATPTGAWVARNAWRYGFVMSYPKGETASTCYAYEPWHYRYVGEPIAVALRRSGMTLREAIWAAYGP